jgi:hypothetical protein
LQISWLQKCGRIVLLFHRSGLIFIDQHDDKRRVRSTKIFKSEFDPTRK